MFLVFSMMAFTVAASRQPDQGKCWPKSRRHDVSSQHIADHLGLDHARDEQAAEEVTHLEVKDDEITVSPVSLDERAMFISSLSAHQWERVFQCPCTYTVSYTLDDAEYMAGFNFGVTFNTSSSDHLVVENPGKYVNSLRNTGISSYAADDKITIGDELVGLKIENGTATTAVTAKEEILEKLTTFRASDGMVKGTVAPKWTLSFMRPDPQDHLPRRNFGAETLRL
eukprot:gnl/MRDRNA2_/MRDRNA2_46019_c0_seq2.p1 gnl/MRDRNA2_/MRDRNA2_46019_c0~~gnl/MRDRNA2_/MRDRNA2_46019_c0_seq2.p1  ORF type:complete len:226 (-),score=27.84 gnl/MRDRNA2_/MRDRNA2_46019_c0_seq2:707-1384(-)